MNIGTLSDHELVQKLIDAGADMGKHSSGMLRDDVQRKQIRPLQEELLRRLSARAALPSEVPATNVPIAEVSA